MLRRIAVSVHSDDEVHRSLYFVDHDGHDFEPYDEFMWSGETLKWWRAWTGDSNTEIPPFQVFGQDGSGGLAVIWIRARMLRSRSSPWCSSAAKASWP